MERKHEACVEKLSKLSNSQRRKMRIRVYQETKQMCKDSDLLREPRPVQIQSAAQLAIEPQPAVDTQVIVFNGDCLEAALQLQEQGYRPAVLNMASSRNPGGGVKSGAGAQEENLFRRTDYFRHLNKHLIRYPLDEEGGVYNPEVLVLRGSEADEYAVLSHPRYIDMVAVAAISRPELREVGGQLCLSPEAEQTTRRKMDTIFALAAQHCNDALVLSAFGCGAYCNPPHQIAQLFKDTSESEPYRGRFRRIVFAIFDDHNARMRHNPKGNILPFSEVFGVETQTSLESLR